MWQFDLFCWATINIGTARIFIYSVLASSDIAGLLYFNLDKCVSFKYWLYQTIKLKDWIQSKQQSLNRVPIMFDMKHTLHAACCMPPTVLQPQPLHLMIVFWVSIIWNFSQTVFRCSCLNWMMPGLLCHFITPIALRLTQGSLYKVMHLMLALENNQHFSTQDLVYKLTSFLTNPIIWILNVFNEFLGRSTEADTLEEVLHWLPTCQ